MSPAREADLVGSLCPVRARRAGLGLAVEPAGTETGLRPDRGTDMSAKPGHAPARR